MKSTSAASRCVKALFAVPLGSFRSRGEFEPKAHVQLPRLYVQEQRYISHQDDAEIDDSPSSESGQIHVFSGP